MRTGPSRNSTRVLALVLALAGLLVAATTAEATSGAAYTTINSTADPGGTGAGQGLHNLHERAEALGGRAEIDSTPGQGTRVRVTIPR